MLTIEEITQKLKPVFEANGVTKAILFGSYANGTATKDSDVDLVIETEPHVRGIRVFGIFADITDTLNMDADIFHQREIIPGGKTDIELEKTGVVIFEK